jgi:hypothetical protein
MKKVTEGRNRKGSLSSPFPSLFTAHCSLFIFLVLPLKKQPLPVPGITGNRKGPPFTKIP